MAPVFDFKNKKNIQNMYVKGYCVFYLLLLTTAKIFCLIKLYENKYNAVENYVSITQNIIKSLVGIVGLIVSVTLTLRSNFCRNDKWEAFFKQYLEFENVLKPREKLRFGKYRQYSIGITTAFVTFVIILNNVC